MWIWRKIEKISWTAKVSNSEVLNRVKENSCIINTINQRKRRWLGHVLRHDVLLRDILEGRMTGKCTRGRKRLQLMSNICEGYEIVKKRAEDRCLWCVSVLGVSDLLNSRIPEEEEEEERAHHLENGILQFPIRMARKCQKSRKIPQKVGKVGRYACGQKNIRKLYGDSMEVLKNIPYRISIRAPLSKIMIWS